MAEPVFGMEIFKYFVDVAEAFGSTGATLNVPNWIFFWGVLFMSFAIIFVVIQKIHFFEDNRGAALIVSIIMAIFIAANSSAVSVITAMFPSLGVIILASLSVLILIAIFVPGALGEEGKMWTIGLGAVLAFLLLFFLGVFSSLGWDPSKLTEMKGLMSLITFLAFSVGVVVLIYGLVKKRY